MGRKDNVWMLPGGDVKPTETVVEAGQRELAEETGLRSTEGERTFSLDADTTFHDVSVLPVRGDSTPKELQAKELQDYMWWDVETALPLSRSTRTILKEYMGAEPPRTGSSRVVEGREAYDWWPSQPSLAEVEAVFPVGGRRQSIDRSLSRPVLGGARPGRHGPARAVPVARRRPRNEAADRFGQPAPVVDSGPLEKAAGLDLRERPAVQHPEYGKSQGRCRIGRNRHIQGRTISGRDRKVSGFYAHRLPGVIAGTTGPRRDR